MFQPSDIIIKSGTKGDRMFFIQEGKKTVKVIGFG